MAKISNVKIEKVTAIFNQEEWEEYVCSWRHELWRRNLSVRLGKVRLYRYDAEEAESLDALKGQIYDNIAYLINSVSPAGGGVNVWEDDAKAALREQTDAIAVTLWNETRSNG